MGELVSLAAHRRARATRARTARARPSPRAVSRPRRVTFYFDLSSPFTYLAAERVDRLFGSLVWRPVIEEILQRPPEEPAVAEERAHALGLPLVWPELGAAAVRPAMRVAALAAEQGRAAPFVLAATRLAFCGGFELDHPDVLAEAAAAANLGLEECLHAAGDIARDGPMEETARRLMAHGVERLPAMRVGRLLFGGEERIAEAAAATALPATRRAG